jgi:hypothetical protein
LLARRRAVAQSIKDSLQTRRRVLELSYKLHGESPAQQGFFSLRAIMRSQRPAHDWSCVHRRGGDLRALDLQRHSVRSAEGGARHPSTYGRERSASKPNSGEAGVGRPPPRCLSGGRSDRSRIQIVGTHMH